LAAAYATATPAIAQCVPGAPDDGDVITCTGTDTNGVNQDALNAGNLDDITLTIEAGATVNNSDEDTLDTILLDDDAVIENNGRLTAQGDDPSAIAVDKDGEVINTATGTITSGKDAINSGGDVVVVNDGTITADDEAVQSDGEVDLTNSGTITAGDKGITGTGARLINSGDFITVDKTIDVDNADNVYVDNSGLIRSTGDEAVEAGDDATVINTGTIEALDDAVQVGQNGMITNSGRIANIGGAGDDPQDAIDIDSGTVINQTGGEILSTFDAAIDFDAGPGGGQITNEVGATISGTVGVLTDGANTGGQTVENAGRITGTSGVALDLGEGNDEAILSGGFGMFDGDILLGEGEDVFRVASFATGDYRDAFTAFGGDGADDLIFEDFRYEHVTDILLHDVDIYDIFLEDTTFSLSIRFSGFEEFFFDDDKTPVTLAQLTADLASVPLPAAGWMLAAGLGGLMVLRRRKARR
jgi:hypothetical protein